MPKTSSYFKENTYTIKIKRKLSMSEQSASLQSSALFCPSSPFSSSENSYSPPDSESWISNAGSSPRVEELSPKDSYAQFDSDFWGLDTVLGDYEENPGSPRKMLCRPRRWVSSTLDWNLESMPKFPDRNKQITNRLQSLYCYLIEKYGRQLNDDKSNPYEFYLQLFKCVNIDLMVAKLLEDIESYHDLCGLRQDFIGWSEQSDLSDVTRQFRNGIKQYMLYFTEKTAGYQKALNGCMNDMQGWSWLQITEINPNCKTDEFEFWAYSFIPNFLTYKFFEETSIAGTVTST